MKSLELGQQILYGDLTTSDLRKGTVTKISKESGWTIVYVDNKEEGGIFSTYCWPVEAEVEIMAYVAKLEEIRAMLDRHQATVYGIRNRY